MGIQEHILVVRQITDEEKWHCAMEEIADHFCGKVSGEEPLLRDHCSNAEDIAEIKKQLSDVEFLACANTTEVLNFGLPSVGLGDVWLWESAYFSVGRRSSGMYRRYDDTEAVAAQDTVMKAEVTAELVNGNKDMAAYRMKRLKTFRHRAGVFQRLPDDERARFAPDVTRLPHGAWLEMPNRFEFRVGGHLRLPLFARHFKHCSSEVSGQCGAASGVLRFVYAVLQKYFPDSVIFYRDASDADVPELLQSASDDVALEARKRTQFYAAVRETFGQSPGSSGSSGSSGSLGSASAAESRSGGDAPITNARDQSLWTGLAKVRQLLAEPPAHAMAKAHVLCEITDLGCCRLVELAGKGKGMVAARHIYRGELILQEKPLLSLDLDDPPKAHATEPYTSVEITLAEGMPVEVCDGPARDSDTKATVVHCARAADAALAKLPEADRAQVWALHDAFEAKIGAKTALGVYQTNCLARGEEGGSVLCNHISRFNHSCTPNVTHAWSPPHERVVAVRDIAAGEELCTHHVNLLYPTAVRRDRLRQLYGCDCQCDVCTAPPERQRASDVARAELRRLDTDMGVMGGLDVQLGLRMVARMEALLRQEGLDNPVAESRFAYDAFQFCAALGDEAAAREWVRRAHAARLVVWGEGTEAVRKLARYVRYPRAHPTWGRQRRGLGRRDESMRSVDEAAMQMAMRWMMGGP